MPRRSRWHISPSTTLTTLTTAVAGAAGAVLLCAGSAAAHVRVIGDVIPGEPATLQFRVPSELADATTVRIAVAVPSGLSVTAVPALDGWTERTVSRSAGQGTRVVWTAEPGHEIKPAASRTFKVKVGPVPDRHSLTFDTEQTYSDGTIAAWNQAKTGAEEPEFPAPVLVVDPDASPSPTAAEDSPQPTGSHTAPAPSAGRWAAIGAGGVAVAALVAVLFRRRGNSGASRA
ncbi:DUF1775 domain-containing protein [Streptomyces sp. NPDC048441]|uniref:DUF1775 domain-containing protein n=1 Tax=Streptomyces sp. NPDC048441 TaxID=3365552 RepID=UPI003714279E